MKTWLARARAFASRVWGYIPISLAGLVMMILAGLVARYDGLANLDMVVVALGVGVVVMGAISCLLVSVRALYLVYSLRQLGGASVITAETGQQNFTEFSLPAAAWIPFIHLSWTWTTPQAEIEPVYRSGHYKEACHFTRRGLHDKLEREFLVEDLLGMAKVRFRRSYEAQIKVLPHYGKLLEPPLLFRLTSGDEFSDPRGDPAGDRVDMRQYVRGDSPRTILWKVFARTRRLMVRVPERALATRPRVCAYLACGEGDEPAAALARVVLEKGLLGPAWRFGCDGQAGYDTQIPAALERIARSGNTPVSAEGGGLHAYLEQARQDGYAQCLLLLPPRLGSQAEAIAQAVTRAGMEVTVCLAVDGVDPPQTGSNWRSWLFYRDHHSFCTAADLRQAAEMWARHPGEVMLVDRQAGVLLGDLRHYQRSRLERHTA